ncbi:MAG: DUF512 domain-containing protein, partial [Lachnospirales bacterium]
SEKVEFYNKLENTKSDNILRNISIATGKLSYNFMSEVAKAITDKFKNTKIQVFPIENDFFGRTITVSGLMCGSDIIGQLKNKNLGDYLFIPDNCVRVEGDLLLDDVSIPDIEKELGVKIIVASCNGGEMLSQILATGTEE